MALGVVVDAQVLQVPGWGDRGVGRYTVGLLDSLMAAGRLRAVTLRPELGPPAGLPAAVAAAGLVRFDCAREAERILAAGPAVRLVPAAFLHCGATDPAGLVTAAHWAGSGTPRVVVVHDLIPLRAPDHYLGAGIGLRRYRARAQWVARAPVVLTDSEHTRQEVIELLGCPPAQVRTILGGVSERFRPADGTDEGLFRGYHADLVDRHFLVCVGGSDPRKNLERLVEAAGLLHARGDGLPLLVVGSLTEDWKARLRQAAEAAGLPTHLLLLLGQIPDDHLVALYRRAHLHVQPSLAEGLGLPVLEAAACGCPSLVSGTTSLAEVAGVPEATFDPTDARSIAEAVADAARQPDRRAAILAAQQELLGEATWERTAARVLSAIDALPTADGAAQPRHRHRLPAGRRPLRICLLGPLPPHGGGIGAYNGRVAAALAGAGTLVDHLSPRPSSTSPVAGVRRLHVASLGRHLPATSYDALVATLGNSEGHLASVAACLAHPAWLWLHEARLPAIATTALDGDSAAFHRLLELAYPGRAPHAAAAAAGWSTLALLEAGVGVTWPLVQRCRGVLVNSEVARRVLLMDLPPGVAAPPIHVLPPACPPVEASGRTSADEAEPLVVAFGIVAMQKQPDLLIDAVALLDRPVRLAFVGPCPAVLEEAIAERAAARGLTERVIVTGTVDDTVWRAWLDRAALAVQLRDTHSGETSAAVLEALAAGLPTVTNLPTAAELPPGTVQLVAAPGAGAVARALEAVLADPVRQAELAAAAIGFARSHSAEGLAQVLSEVTTTLGAP